MDQTTDTRNQAAPAGSINTDELLNFEELNQFRTVVAPEVKRMSREALSSLVARSGNTASFISATTAMELTARQPYTAAGKMDFYRPGRWDSTSNLVNMTGIVTGPQPGQWEGTVGYIHFKAPKTGLYLIATNFSGYKTTMQMSGPWGVQTAYTATVNDSGAVIALWNGTAGSNLYFSISCKGLVLGYLESIQVFAF